MALQQTELTELLKEYHKESVKNFDAILDLIDGNYLGDVDNAFSASPNKLYFVVEPSKNSWKAHNGGEYRTFIFAKQEGSDVTVYLNSSSEFENANIIFEGRANLRLAIASLLISL